jgi:hypothetical protein
MPSPIVSAISLFLASASVLPEPAAGRVIVLVCLPILVSVVPTKELISVVS